MPTRFDFGGRVALVTASAAGIGEATARILAEGGARVGLADLDPTGLEQLASDLRGKGVDVLPVQVDATRGDSVEAMMEKVVDHFGGLDILVNGVGGWTKLRTVETTSEEEWTRGMALNVTSTFLVSKAAIPHLKQSGRGRIISIASEVARIQVYFTTPDYVAGKAAVIALGRYLAKELGPYQCTVNTVAPGPTWSPRTRIAWSEGQPEKIAEDSVLGRIADPEDIAAVIAFLASDEARHITGATVDVHGGHHLY
jgi:3-oxoacyl-[acyl-carrier protein] reductase